MSKIAKEKEVIELMIKIYCNKKHKSRDDLCSDCKELLTYAHKRLDCCKFGEKKTSCKRCPIHCYEKDMKEKVKNVMKFSGPRLIIYKPIDFLKHLFY